MNAFRKTVSKVVLFVLMIVMVLLVYATVAQVFARFVLNNPSSYTEELSIYALIWATMIGSAYGFMENKHMSLLLVKEKLEGTRTGTVIHFVVDGVILFFAIFVMVWGGSMLSMQNADQVTNILRLPMNIVYSIVPICGVLIAISIIMNNIERRKLKKEND